MSTIQKGESDKNAVSAVPAAHPEAAQERVNELRRMRELIPRFVMLGSAKQVTRLNGVASVPPEFVELTAMAVANHNALVRGDAATPAEVRDLMNYADAYSPLADELEALAQFVRHSVASARDQAGSEALTTYALAQRLAKRPEHADLVPYVADMRRALGRRRKPTPEELERRAAAKAAKAAKTPPAPDVPAAAAAPDVTTPRTW